MDNRGDLREFLTSRRERLTPAEMDLTSAPGLQLLAFWGARLRQ